MERIFEIKVELSKDMRDYYGIDADSIFAAHLDENGKLVVGKCTQQDLKEYADAVEREYEEGYEAGYAEAFDTCHRRGYAKGYFDAMHGNSYNKEFPEDEGFDDEILDYLEEDEDECPENCFPEYCAECTYYDSETNTCVCDD